MGRCECSCVNAFAWLADYVAMLLFACSLGRLCACVDVFVCFPACLFVCVGFGCFCVCLVVELYVC